ncbi:MAG TPA: ABC transporter substrate-binding protein [Acidimicrobiia bacterium]|nr:ABC transporter substrate-binding protein [Acidimicrobiia bacterium]
MTRRRPWLVVVALLAVFSLVVVACGDDDAETTTTAAETTTTAEATTTTAEVTTTTAATTTTEAPAELLFDVGVTLEPCPDSPNPDNGCIYLGNLSDFSGAFATQGPLLGWGHEDFWNRVNEAGGIGVEGAMFDVAITAENTCDTGYQSEQHVACYEQIRGNVAALAETLGTTQTLAALPLFIEDDTVASVSTWYSGWSFPEIDSGLIFETGTNYCFEAMNGFDFAVGAMLQAGVPANDAGVPQFTYAIVYFPGDYGGDYGFGAKYAASQYGLGDPIAEVPIIPISAGGTMDEAVATLVAAKPNVIFLPVAPVELATIMGGVYGGGHQTAMYIGAGPTWNTGLLAQEALVPLLQAAYFQTAYWLPWMTDSPGHTAMRAAAEAAERPPEAASAAYSAGWTMQYPIKAALESAIANGDLTRAGIAAAASQLTDVDYEGMLPNRGFAGTAAEDAWRGITVNGVVPENPDGLASVMPGPDAAEIWTGPTAAAYDFAAPCTIRGG